MEEIPVTQARAQLSDLVLRVEYRAERILLTRHGKPVAALVPVDEVQPKSSDSDTGDAGQLHSLTSTRDTAPSDLGLAARYDR